MRIDLTELTPPRLTQTPIQPGELWEIDCRDRGSIVFSEEEKKRLYSPIALESLQGKGLPRYAAIVQEPSLELQAQVLGEGKNTANVESEPWQVVSVMLLSVQIEFISDRDLILPAAISGCDRDLLVQTWHVLPMLASQLSHPVGRRLSRDIYDLLLDVGEFNRSVRKQEIETLGLRVGIERSDLQAFHRQEEAWTDVLKVPLAACRTYFQKMEQVDGILEAALQIERERLRDAIDPPQPPVEQEESSEQSIPKSRIDLNQWFRHSFDTEWQSFQAFFQQRKTRLAWGIRSSGNGGSEEISTLLAQLSVTREDAGIQRIVKRLGDLATSANTDVVQTLLTLLQTTQDDETLWTIIDSLVKIDPNSPTGSTGGVKLVDLGMQLPGYTVALAISAVQKANQHIGVRLQIYPTGEMRYLPSQLKLILLDDLGQVLREVVAREADLYLQLKLNGQSGEKFSVCVSLGDAKVVENFVL